MGESSQFSIVPRFVWQGCQPTEVVVYCALAGRVNWETGVCWPSKSTIAKEAGISVSTVGRALKRLEAVGAIQIDRRKTDRGDFTSNLYRLPFAINRPVDNSAGGGVMGDPTWGQRGHEGGVMGDPLTRTIEREGLTQPKLSPDRCRHLPVDGDGYCTACGCDVVREENK